MCGIVGYRTNDSFLELKEKLPEAVGFLSHRGPDDSGVFFDPGKGVGLGHRRLSIIDLSREAHQPMASDDEKVVLVYNGEIYNFKEIRTTLQCHGHQFRTQSDTEVVLKSYLQWGTDALKRFVGMFAFAIWDKSNERLFLARDRLGIKPLFFYWRNGLFLFASELKAIMVLPGFERDVDTDAIPLFLHYQYVPAPKTIFRNTFKLLPGHCAIYEKGTFSVRSYWDFSRINPYVRDAAQSEVEALNTLESLLKVSVSNRLLSDVPLGALLSVGIDSSLVVALMQEVSASPVRTFSIGFEEKGYDEAPWAAKVAKHLGTRHTEFYIQPEDARDIISRLPEVYDEPFADSSAIPTFLVCQLARSQVTVALSGDGGDEQFCGYVRYWMVQSMAKILNQIPEGLRAMLALFLKKIPISWVESCYVPWQAYLPQRFRVANFRDKWQKLLYLMKSSQISDIYRATISLWSRDEIHELLGRGIVPGLFEEVFNETKGWPVLSRLMEVDRRTYLPDALLTKVDRASMAVGLEVRVPLLDHRVVEYSSGLPDRFKYRNGTGKYLLKQLLFRHFPEGLFKRPKMGFGVPLGNWFRLYLKEMLLDYLSSDRLKKEGLFSPDVIERQIKEHLLGEADHHQRLWALLMWEMWRARWVK